MNVQRGKLSLQTRLKFLLVAVLFPILALQAWVYYDRYRTLYDHEIQANLEIARAAGGMFKGLVNAVLQQEASIETILTLPQPFSVEAMNHILAKSKEGASFIRNFLWLNSHGIVVASNLPETIGIDFSDRTYFLEVTAGKDWSIGDLVIGRATAKPLFSIAKAVRDKAGMLQGIIVATIDEEHLDRGLKLNRSKGGGIAIMDSKGMLVYRFPKIATTWEDRNWLKTYPYLQQALDGKEYVATVFAPYENKTRIIANVPLPFGWVAGAGRTESEVTRPIIAELGKQAVLFLAVMVAGLIGATAVSRRIAEHVNELREKSDAIGRGEYGIQTQTSHSREFQELSDALNLMSEKVRLRETALQGSENRFRLIFEGVEVGISELDENNRIIMANGKECEITGRSREELIGMAESDLWHPEDRPRCIKLQSDLQAGRSQSFIDERRYVRPDGSVVYVRKIAQRLPGSGNATARRISIVEDITARQRLQNERDLTIELLRLVNASAGMTDLVRNATTFFQQKSGVEAVGIRLRDGDDYPYYEARGFPQEFLLAENSLCARNGTGSVLRDDVGDPVIECMCGNVIRQRFDPSKPFFTARGSFWTNSTTELLSKTSEADRQARTRNRCHGEGFESVALMALHVGKERLGLLQLNDKRKDAFSAESILLWERLADYLAVAISRIRSEEALRESQAELQRANRELERKVSERTADLAHKVDELRKANEQLDDKAAQLKALAGDLTLTEQRERKRLSQILHDGLQQHLVSAKMRLGGFAEEIDSAGHKQTVGEIEKILDESVRMSRSLSAELSPPILYEGGLSEGLEWLARRMLEKHHFTVDLSIESSPELKEDVKVLLFEGVRELLFNAVKYAKVSQARVGMRQMDGAGLQVTVSDEGAGFDPGQLKSAGEIGGGFGLFSIRERIGLIGGSLEIDSAPGKGSRFALMVPRGQAPPAHLPSDRRYLSAAEPQKDHREDKGTTIRVLIADDHALFRNGLDRLLKNEPGLEVVGHATDGQEAVNLAETLKPGVILMDISMPNLNGIEATRIIHQEHPDIRIIGLSMYEDQERAQVMRDAGATDYKTKGCATAELVAAIRACTKERESSPKQKPHGNEEGQTMTSK